jgi:hypothetical protein
MPFQRKNTTFDGAAKKRAVPIRWNYSRRVERNDLAAGLR